MIELPGSVKRVLHGILRLEPPRLNPSTRGASETEYEWGAADRCKFSDIFYVIFVAQKRQATSNICYTLAKEMEGGSDVRMDLVRDCGCVRRSGICGRAAVCGGVNS